MNREYSNDYFRNRIKTHRLTISRLPRYKTIDELLKIGNGLENQKVSQNQGREQ